ncbi:glycosyltransferase family 2 protein [Microbulbifer bruguierae]|uniref:Glycosyltransferase family 2 protein n=1 Tax=Microbulbifer bruguierae TaxID=3029061 RepID=A0ABY8NBT9_9GAMM|nr:glycosyltransferase family 2 protein [Microbulbifer bruguierae]WGL16391.1 glycosyltransferase family 2 protein [Microbulbifer bruguierae]
MDRKIENSAIEVSFCIPVMNRLGDIQSTLRKNLEDNREDCDIVEFIVISFDHDDGTAKWVESEFQNELATGYLKFYHLKDLEFWHFGKAKNAFKPYVSGKIYASLDGDNFTGYRGGRHILDIFQRYQYKCIFHQFQGDWGDGTCGRISIRMEDYLQWGYDEDFLPRQWDEMDAMLSVLVNQPGTKYICYKGEGKNIIKKSHPFRRFLEESSISIEQIELEDTGANRFESDRAAVGEHNSNYVQDDAKLRLASVYNHLLSYIKNTSSHDLKDKYISEISNCQKEIVSSIDVETLRKWYLKCESNQPNTSKVGAVCLVSCIKNEPNLKEWYEYYKSIGVDSFFLIDDGSVEPVSETFKDCDDVFVWSPVVGQFKFAKTLWMEILLNSYCQSRWTYIVDSDEYVELVSAGSESRNKTLEFVAGHGREYFSGYLLDLYPGGSEYVGSGLQANNITLDDCKYYQFRPANLQHRYVQHNTAVWSYGEHSSWAYSLDIRYRCNGSLDSLRKFPLVRWREKMHLNQGFHDLIIDGVKRTPKDLECEFLLPIRHYKIYSLAQQSIGANEKSVDQYHSETKINLTRMLGSLNKIIRTCIYNPYSYKFSSPYLIPTPTNKKLLLVNVDSLGKTPEVNHWDRGNVIKFISADKLEVKGDHIFAASFQDACNYILRNTPFSKYKIEDSGLTSFSI